MPERRRYIIPFIGNMGNAMLQLMIARSLMDRLGDGELITNNRRVLDVLAPWDLPIRLDESPPRTCRTVRGPVNDIAAVAAEIAAGEFLDVEIGTCNLHVSQYPSLASARELFRLKVDPDVAGFGSDSLLISIRGNEILRGVHRDYVVAPISFYRHLIENTGLRPVFAGQIGEDIYSQAIRDAFPAATYVPSVSPIADFTTIRRSKNIVIPTSTFSMLAAWLSDADTVFMPLIGGFNPLQRPDGNNVFCHDPRYRFFLFPVFHMKDIAAVLPGLEESLSGWREISPDEARRLSTPQR